VKEVRKGSGEGEVGFDGAMSVARVRDSRFAGVRVQ